MTPSPEKWTPEPWTWCGNTIDGPDYMTVLEVRDTPENAFPELQSGELICKEEDRERIVACVNACAGIHDPDKAIKAARIALAEAINNMAFYGPGVPVSWRESLALLGGDDAT